MATSSGTQRLHKLASGIEVKGADADADEDANAYAYADENARYDHHQSADVTITAGAATLIQMRSWAALSIFICASTARAEGPALPTSAAHEVVVLPAPNDPIRGPRYAPITLEVWVQLGHSPSALAQDAARRAVERAPLGDVRELVHFLPWGPPSADLATFATLEAQAQGRFWPFLDRLLAERSASFGAGDLERIGREVGLDTGRLEAHLAAFQPRTPADRLLAEARVHGSPGRVSVNGRPVHGLATDENIGVAIEAARPRARAALAEGVPLGRLYEQLVEEARVALQAPEPPAVRTSPPRVSVNLTGALARGPSLAPITLVVFSNFSCPSCLELAALARRVAAAHPGQVRVVWKHWSPPSWGSGTLLIPAAAEAQGRFWTLHDQLVPSHGHPHLASRAGELEREAKRAGVDLVRLLLDQEQGVLRAIVDRDLADVNRLRLLYDPVLVVNGIVLAGLQSADVIEDVIAEELSRGLVDRLKAP